MLYLAAGAGFICLWLFVSAAISLVGGWLWLARDYPCPRGHRPAAKVIFGSIGINCIGSYRQSVTVGVDAAGIDLRPIAPFRFMHSPIFIPWSEMARVQTGKLLWVSIFGFTTLRHRRTVQLFGSAATLVRRASPLPAGERTWRARRGGADVLVRSYVAKQQDR